MENYLVVIRPDEYDIVVSFNSREEALAYANKHAKSLVYLAKTLPYTVLVSLDQDC